MATRLGFELAPGATVYVQSVKVALGRFTPAAWVRLRGATWDLTADFGVSVGAVRIVPIGQNRDKGKPIHLVFNSGGDGVLYEVEGKEPVEVKAWNINAYGKERNRYPVRLGQGIPRIFVDAYAEFEDGSLITVYSVSVDSRPTIVVHQAIGEEYWRHFNQSVFDSAKGEIRVS